MLEVNTIDEQLMVRFLLGELREEARLKVEERLFKDDSFYRQMLAVQEELADDYVQDNLSASQRSLFEQYFLRSPRRQKRVEFAATLSRALAGTQQSKVVGARSTGPWWQSLRAFIRPQLVWATPALALVLLIAVSWLVLENRRLASPVEQARRLSESLRQQTRASDVEAQRRIQELEQEIATLRGRGGEMETQIQQKQQELEALRRATRARRMDQSSGLVATFILPPGLTRGTDEPEKVIIPASARVVQLQLDLEKPETYQRYVIEVRTARGNLVCSKSGLKMKPTAYGQAVSLNISPELLSTGEYEISLKGVTKGRLEVVGYYYLIALKR